LFGTFVFVFILSTTYAQNKKDTGIVSFKIDSVKKDTGMASFKVDSVKKDTIHVSGKKNFKLEASVVYSAQDSIIFNLEEEKAYLFNKSAVQYQDVDLKSYYIEIDMNQNEAFSKGRIDSTGKEVDKPQFKDGSDEFVAHTLRYNFKTKKGIITDVTTEQSGGYLHGSKTKKMENNDVCLVNGKYTTCSLEHPHFYIALTKAKVIPNDKIVTGPAYLVIEDVPIPLFLPFGFFPNKKGNKSGIIIPEYGEEEVRGFFLKNGGYYFAISDKMDASLIGEGYTKGSWGASLLTNYKKRYKYTGNFLLSYSDIIVSERGLPDYKVNKAYSLRWNHAQDSKAHPFHNFSANVNIASQSYNQYNTVSYENRLRSEMQSSISYRQQWPNSPFNFSANVRHSQNFSDSTISLTAPDLYLSMSRIYPFKPKVSKDRFYEKIGLSLNSNLQNTLTAKEAQFFTENTLHQMRNGIKHSIPLSANWRILKYFNMGPSLTYTERWYLSSIHKTWNDKQINGSITIPAHLSTDTIQKFVRSGDWILNIPFTTQLYGFYVPRNSNSRFKGIRHMVTPTVGFSWRPDYSKTRYYGNVQTDTLGTRTSYSIFQNNIFQGPPSGKYGMINFSLNNNFEMKVKSKNDTVNKINKISLLDQLSISTSYNITLDSLNWQPLQLQARTTLFKLFNLYGNATYDLYTYDSLGRSINHFEYNKSKKIGNLTQASMSVSVGLNSDGFVKDKSKQTTEAAKQAATAAGLPENYLNYYVDFKVPWTLQLSYNLNYSRKLFNTETKKYDFNTIEGLTFSGDISITSKWKLSFSSGYDFESKKFTYTNFNIFRDLHCWEMRFSWIPFGPYRSYNFQINVKSTILQDLKLIRKRSYLENY
jgi:hypothetical protein